MLKMIHLENYKSFGSLTFDLTLSKYKVKNYAFIYGENGVGKSTIISSISFLMSSINSLNFKSMINGVLSRSKSDLNRVVNTSLLSLKALIDNSGIKSSIKIAKLIGSTSPMKLSFSFLIDKKVYAYSLLCDDKSYVEEKLVVENEILFDIKSITNMNVLKVSDNKEYMDYLINKIKQNYGINTLLSILVDEKTNTNGVFFKKNVNPFINALIKELMNYTIVCNNEFSPIHVSSSIKGLLDPITNGDIPKQNENNVKKTTDALNLYLTAWCSNVIEGFYKTKTNDNGLIHYDLFIRRVINGKQVDVPWNLESSGTLNTIKLFPLILKAVQGQTILFDEIDSNIHDLLFTYIFDSVKDDIRGQIITTTHNTKLLETIKAKNAYVLSANAMGERSIDSIDHIADKRIQKTNNMNYQYLHGLFGGVPVTGFFDVNSISNTILGGKDGKK